MTRKKRKQKKNLSYNHNDKVNWKRKKRIRFESKLMPKTKEKRKNAYVHEKKKNEEPNEIRPLNYHWVSDFFSFSFKDHDRIMILVEWNELNPKLTKLTWILEMCFTSCEERTPTLKRNKNVLLNLTIHSQKYNQIYTKK